MSLGKSGHIKSVITILQHKLLSIFPDRVIGEMILTASHFAILLLVSIEGDFTDVETIGTIHRHVLSTLCI
jgi:hypothetical protein